jgi:hypothetical protein
VATFIEHLAVLAIVGIGVWVGVFVSIGGPVAPPRVAG